MHSNTGQNGHGVRACKCGLHKYAYSEQAYAEERHDTVGRNKTYRYFHPHGAMHGREPMLHARQGVTCPSFVSNFSATSAFRKCGRCHVRDFGHNLCDIPYRLGFYKLISEGKDARRTSLFIITGIINVPSSITTCSSYLLFWHLKPVTLITVACGQGA